jgi:hypothetical protein
MTRFVPKLLVVGFLICSLITALALEVPLKYEKFAEKAQGFRPYGYSQFGKTTDPPKGEWKLPELKSKLPIYAMSKLGSKERLFILDRQKTDDKFYNRLYFDGNANRDLTDDRIIEGQFKAQPFMGRVVFPAVDTTVEVEGKSLPYSFVPTVYQYGVDTKGELSPKQIDESIYFHLSVNCCYTGSFELGGQAYQVVLSDSNGNGYFNDKLSFPKNVVYLQRTPLYPEGDFAYLTARDAATTGTLSYYDGQVCSDMVWLNGNLFDMGISIAEGKMMLTPSREKTFPLKLPMEVERLSFCTSDTTRSVMAFEPGKELQVPKGEYRLVSYRTHRKDQKGDLWSLNAMATKESPVAMVNARAGATLLFGEPYVPVAEVPEWSMQNFRQGNRQVELEFNVEGAGRELVTNLSHDSGNLTDIPLSKSSPNRPTEPSYRITKMDGTIVSQGKFQYG